MMIKAGSEVIEDIRAYSGRALGRATASFRSLPDFLVIGTQKGGTTSLFQYLVQHPDVSKATRKEIHYFDLHFRKGLRWYKSFFPLNSTREYHLRRTGNALIAGEATPFYLFHPLIPGRVKEVLPKARLIVLIRDPVERAFSHYNHIISRRQIGLSFREVVEREIQHLNCEPEWDSYQSTIDISGYGIIARGFYAEQLERWLCHFPRTQMLVLKSEDLFSDPHLVILNTYKFLKLEVQECQYFPVHNRGKYIDHIDSSTRRILESIYEPHNQKLNVLLGDSFSRWDHSRGLSSGHSSGE
jgi:hypothetical protein